MELIIDPNTEISVWESSDYPYSERMIDRIKVLKKKLFKGAWIKKIVWDEEGGYPKHSWGFIQYTLRPYRQGYGCDGTTDNNIHLIASTMAQREGWNYEAIYREAYGDESDHAWLHDWLEHIQKPNGTTRKETLLPVQNAAKNWALALNDLYQINNRSLEAVLEELVLDTYPKAEKYLSF